MGERERERGDGDEDVAGMGNRRGWEIGEEEVSGEKYTALCKNVFPSRQCVCCWVWWVGGLTCPEAS